MPGLADTIRNTSLPQLSPHVHPHFDVNLRTKSKKFRYSQGDRPLSDFVIERGVGVGGFGEVYYARTEAGKEVALKRIQRNLDIELRGVRQCLNLRHPNLVELYDVRYDEENSPWVVMQFIGGDSLSDVIRRNPNGLSDSVIRHWFKGIAAGVLYLHDNDVVHRDLKPGNIFLDSGIVKIGDYGLAKMINDSQGSGQTESVGTFHYMAPEIGRGKYGRRIDIYALGIMLHEMVTGDVPFNGESSQEIIMKHLTSEADVSGISEPYRTTIQRALAKDPDRRYSTVDAMLADLEFDTGYFEANRLHDTHVLPSSTSGGDLDTAIDALPIEAANLPVPSLEARHLPGLAIERPIVNAEVVPEQSSLGDEPVSRYLHSLLQQLRSNWEEANFNTPTKFILLLIAVLLFVINANLIVPAVFFAGTVYAGYLMIWMLLAPTKSPVSDRYNLEDTAPLKPLDNQRALRKQYSSGKSILSREIFAKRTAMVRVQELIGSLILSTIVVAVLTVLMLIVGTTGVDNDPYVWAPMLAWMGTTSLAGTWIILALGKFFESRDGDQALRRFSMLVVGMIIGGIATVLSDWLLFEPKYLLAVKPVFGGTSTILYHPNGLPRLLAAVGYFGLLTVVLNWWALTDPLRETRLSMLTSVGFVAAAIVIHFVLPYPRGFLIAATIAMAVQISAPWLSVSQRQKLVDSGAPLLPRPQED